jgi:RNA polymerase sigma-B factor
VPHDDFDLILLPLPKRERRIVDLRFRQDLTQYQIAERIGISQMHVSRLLGKSLSRLRTAMAPASAS